MRWLTYIAILLLALLLLLLVAGTTAVSQTTTFSGNGNWNTSARWSNGIPTASTPAVITPGATCTIPAAYNAVCQTLTDSVGNSATNVTFSANTSTLVIGGGTGALTFTGGGTSRSTFAIGAGTLVCGTTTVNAPGGGRTTISVSTGAVVITGDLNLANNQTRFTFSRAGKLNITGNFPSGGNFTANNSTVSFNGSGSQTIGQYNYYNLTLSKGGAKTLAGNITVGGTFTDSVTTPLSCGAFIPTLQGNIVINDTISGTGGITVSGGANGSTISGTGKIANTGNFNINKSCSFTTTANLTFNGTIMINSGGGGGGGTRTVTNNGTVRCTAATSLNGSSATRSVWVNAANSYLFVEGSLLNTGTLNANGTSNTVIYKGSGAQTVKTGTYYSLSVYYRSPGTVTFTGTDNVAGVFNPAVGVTYATGGTINFNGTGAQTIPPFYYNNLTSSSTGARTLSSTGTIYISSVFTPGTNAYTNTGSTINFWPPAAQTIPAFNYYNFVISGARAAFNVTLANGTIGIAGSFTNSATFTTGTYIKTGNTINYNGTGAETIIGFNYNNLASSSTGGRTLDPVNTIYIAGTFTPAATNTYTITSNTINYNGTGAQTISAFGYNNLTTSGARGGASITFANSGTVGIAGVLTLTATPYITTGSTVDYNGSGTQSIVTASITYNNLSCSTGGSKTPASALTTTGTLTINSGATFIGGGYSHNIGGNWINNTNPGFDSSGTITLTGANTSIGGTYPTTFNTLQLTNASSNYVLNNNVNVSTVTMNAGDTLNTGVNYINIKTSGGRSANGIIVGTIRRTHAFVASTSYSFESQYTLITPTGSNVTSITSMTVIVTRGAVLDYFLGTAINRQDSISYTQSGPVYAGGGNVQFHYYTSELNGNTEASMSMLQYSSPTWVVRAGGTINTTNHYGTLNGATNISGRWTLGIPATVRDWKGGTAFWNTGSNWYGGTAPQPADIARFGDSVFTVAPSNPPAVTCKGLVFGGTHAITINFINSVTVGVIAAEGTGNATHTLQHSAAVSVSGYLLTSNGSGGNINNINIVGTSTSTASFTLSGDAVIGGSSSLNYSAGSNVVFGGNLTQSGTASISAPPSTASMTIGGNFTYTSTGAFTPNGGTVVYNGGSPQNVGPVPYYNLTISKNSGSIATLSSAATVANTFLISSGTFLTNGPLTVADSVTINSGATLDGGNSNLTVGGNFTVNNGGTFTADLGTVIFNGVSSLIKSNTSPLVLNNMAMVAPVGTVTLGVNLLFNNNFVASSGILDMAGFTAAGTGDTVTMTGTSYVKTQGQFLAGFVTYNLAPTSTIEYYSTSTQNIDTGFTFGNLILTNGGFPKQKVMIGNDSLGGSLTINSGVFLNAGSFTLNIGGNWTNNGTFTYGTGLVNFYGPAGNITGPATTFNKITFSDSTFASANITANDTLFVSGTFNAGGTTVTSSGTFIATGEYLGTGTLTFPGTAAQNLTFSSGFVMSSPGTVNFNGNVAPIINPSTAPTFFNLINSNTNASGISFQSDFTANGMFTNSKIFYGNTFTDSLNGGFTNTGTFNNDGLVVFYTGSTGQNIKLENGIGNFFITTGIVQFSGNVSPATITGTSGDTLANDVIISNTSVSGITVPAGYIIKGDVSVDTLATMNMGVNTYTVQGNIFNKGTLRGSGTSTIVIGNPAAVSDTISGDGLTQFDYLVIADSVIVPQNITIMKTIRVNAVLIGSGSTISFADNGTAATDSIRGTSTTFPVFDVVDITKGTGTLAITIEMDSVSLLAIHKGTVIDSLSKIIESSGGGAMSMDTLTTFKVGGTNAVPVFSNGYTFNVNSTIWYNGSTQTITPVATGYGNLILTPGGTTKTVGAGTVIQVNGYLKPDCILQTTGGEIDIGQ
ncbi:MAG: beta strand repeat-containing protein [Bacteroidota bacterium]